MPPPFEMSPTAVALYATVEAFADHDEENDWALAHFCNAIGGMFAEVDELVSDTEEGIGWSSVVDLDRAKEKWLGWLAQFVGVVLINGLTDPQQRQRIQETDGFKRGKPEAIQGAARSAPLTGTQTVYLVERHGSVARTTIATLVSETPDPAAVVERILAQKPGGDIFAHVVVAGGDYNTLYGTHADYDEVLDTYATYAEVLADPAKQ